jgi:hypothetical protein
LERSFKIASMSSLGKGRVLMLVRSH